MKFQSDYVELTTCDAQLNPSSGQVMLMDMQGRRIHLTWSDFKALVALYRKCGAEPNTLSDAPEGWL